MHTRLYIPFLLLLCGCSWIDDDLSDCPDPAPAYTLDIFFTFMGGEATDMDPADVNHLSLYIFDSSGYFVSVFTDESPGLGAGDYRMTVQLEKEDRYRVVAWGNVQPEYGYTAGPVSSTTSIETLSVQVETDPDGYVPSTIPHLFYGSLDLASPTSKAGAEAKAGAYTIELAQHTYTLHVTTRGLPATDAVYAITLQNEYDRFTFLNQPISSGDVLYTVDCPKDDQGQPYGSLRTIGLHAGSNAVFTFVNATADYILYSCPLIPLIEEVNRQGAGIDFTTTHHFYIDLAFDPVTLDVSVSINGWSPKEEEKELRTRPGQQPKLPVL